MEAYDRAIGPADMHLIEQALPRARGTFADGRYPKRNRLPTSCYWKNERAIYKNWGDGLEVAGILLEDPHDFNDLDMPSRLVASQQIAIKVDFS